MHMARLQDSGRMAGKYSLAALTSDYNAKMIENAEKLPQLLKQSFMRERPSTKNNPEREKELD